jgi:hypothetical protein
MRLSICSKELILKRKKIFWANANNFWTLHHENRETRVEMNIVEPLKICGYY